MSVLLNFGPLSQPATKTKTAAAASSHLQIVVNEERAEKRRKVGDRVAEGELREAIAVGQIEPQRVRDKDAAEQRRGGEIGEAAHADREGQQRHREQDQRV